jgi:hypothetical protein
MTYRAAEEMNRTVAAQMMQQQNGGMYFFLCPYPAGHMIDRSDRTPQIAAPMLFL